MKMSKLLLPFLSLTLLLTVGCTKKETTSSSSSKKIEEDTGEGYSKVDFTKAEISNIGQTAYQLDGCPSTGEVNFLVLPVEFSDSKAADKGFTTEIINKAFNGPTDSTFQYYSVGEYFAKSSYGKFTPKFNVLDKWYQPSKPSTYYLDPNNTTKDYLGNELELGDQMVIEEILTQLDEENFDFTKYDLDQNGCIDGVIVINTLEIDPEVTMQWAYQWNNYLLNDAGDDYLYHGSNEEFSLNNYFWGSCDFLYSHIGEDENGEPVEVYTHDVDPTNTYTFIHELSHVIGAADYYDTTYEAYFYDEDGNPVDMSAMKGCDVMDAYASDHSPFTKFEYGWVTETKWVNTEAKKTFELRPFESSGDTLVFGNDYDPQKGAFQEYYIVSYYTNTGLNYFEKDGQDTAGFFSRDGIVIYHVDASYIVEEEEGFNYYYLVYNNDFSYEDYEKGLNTDYFLLTFVKSQNDTFTYVAGDRMPTNLKDHNGKKLPYSLQCNYVNEEKASVTLTISK